VGHPFFGDLNALARAGVAPDAWRTAVDSEAAKTANFDPMAFDQGMAHGVEDRFDGELGVTVCELRKAGGQFVNEIRAGHEAGAEEGFKKIPFRILRRSAAQKIRKGMASGQQLKSVVVQLGTQQGAQAGGACVFT
jgi:hypothetical protein